MATEGPPGDDRQRIVEKLASAGAVSGPDRRLRESLALTVVAYAHCRLRESLALAVVAYAHCRLRESLALTVVAYAH
jgi:uncharacterized Ntn-hydrolase superfamily protein